MYKGCTVVLGSECSYNFKKENIKISKYNLDIKQKESLVTMPDGPWNWEEQAKEIYLDGPGDISLPNPNLMEPDK